MPMSDGLPGRANRSVYGGGWGGIELFKTGRCLFFSGMVNMPLGCQENNSAGATRHTRRVELIDNGKVLLRWLQCERCGPIKYFERG